MRPVSRYWCTTIQESKPWTLRETVTVLPPAPRSPFPLSTLPPPFDKYRPFRSDITCHGGRKKRRGEGGSTKEKVTKSGRDEYIVRCIASYIPVKGELNTFPGFYLYVRTWEKNEYRFSSRASPIKALYPFLAARKESVDSSSAISVRPAHSMSARPSEE